jgi:threonyl-tRNA synthetase
LPPTVGITEIAMISIRLPDGSVRQYEHPVTVAEVAASIGPGLAKAALGGKVDGKLVDTSTSSIAMHRSPSSPTRMPTVST